MVVATKTHRSMVVGLPLVGAHRLPLISRIQPFDQDDITTLDGNYGGGGHGNGFKDVTVAEYDPERSIVFFDIRGGAAAPSDAITRLDKAQSNTELRFAWDEQTTLSSALHVSGWILEFERGVKVQNINEEVEDQGTTKTYDITIPDAVDTRKTFILVSYAKSGGNFGNDDAFSHKLLDSTTVRITMEIGINSMEVSLQVVEMDGCFVEHIVETRQAATTATSFNGATWSSFFPRERTIVIPSFATSIPEFEDCLWGAFPDYDNQRVVYERFTGTTGDFQFASQIVRLPSGFRVLHGRNNHADSVSNVSVTLPFAIDTEWAIARTVGMTGQSISKCKDPLDDFNDARSLPLIDHSMQLTSDTRTTTGDAYEMAWEIILPPTPIEEGWLAGVLSGGAAAAQNLNAQLISGGSVLSPGLLSELLPQLLNGGSVLSPALLPKIAAQRLSGGSTTEPSLLPLVSPQRLSGGSVLDPGLLAEVHPQRLSGGATVPPSLLSEVHPQRLSGGITLEPVLSLGLTVSPQLLSGGSVLDPSLLAEIHPQLLSGGSVTLPTILPEIHPQRLSGGVVLSPELLAEIHPQLLSGGAVLLPTVVTDQLLNAQLLSGGSVLSPSLLAELHPQLISGGSVLLPVVSPAGVSVQLLDDGFVLLPVISGARFINPQLLSGGSVLSPALLIYLSGVFRVWVIDGPPRTLTVKAPPRTLIVPDE